MAPDWNAYLGDLGACLRRLSVRDGGGRELAPDQGLAAFLAMAQEVKGLGGCAYFVGNGASASMACHFATDVSKNARLRTQVFTDPAMVTAMANDLSYEDVFAEPLSWLMEERDLLVAISSSGNSPNILKAAATALDRGGRLATLSAMGPDNALRGLGHLNFYIPAATYGQAESGHTVILHRWTDMLVGLQNARSVAHGRVDLRRP
jgi:D-sedoheptulose 7-phosphate isomerase